jgi:hypothetical protein
VPAEHPPDELQPGLELGLHHLLRAGVEHARTLAVATPDPVTARSAIRYARRLNPNHPGGGTAFRPARGRTYFEEL